MTVYENQLLLGHTKNLNQIYDQFLIIRNVHFHFPRIFSGVRLTRVHFMILFTLRYLHYARYPKEAKYEKFWKSYAFVLLTNQFQDNKHCQIIRGTRIKGKQSDRGGGSSTNVAVTSDSLRYSDKRFDTGIREERIEYPKTYQPGY